VIWLQTVTVFWLGGGTISLLLNIHGVNDLRQAEIHTAQPLLPGPIALILRWFFLKLRRHKSPRTGQISV